MTPPKSTSEMFKRACELTEFEGYNSIQTRDYQDGKMAGEEKENARLRPLLEQVGKVIEELEMLKAEDDLQPELMWALASLRAACEGEK